MRGESRRRGGPRLFYRRNPPTPMNPFYWRFPASDSVRFPDSLASQSWIGIGIFSQSLSTISEADVAASILAEDHSRIPLVMIPKRGDLG